MSEKMMEKLARAVYVEMVNDGGNPRYHPSFEYDRDLWEKCARSVLLALREPTEGMVEAMYANGAEGDPKEVASDFTAAIDHILNESGQPANPT